MPAYKKYKQLKLPIESTRDHYNSVVLQFKIHQKEVEGILNGSVAHWTFQSQSPAFLKQVPSGMLSKYSLWMFRVPPSISKLYNSISDAALKAGYEMHEKEEVLD